MAKLGLHNCDREPIHVPGSIQPHGALLAMERVRGTIAVASDNLAAQLGVAGDVFGLSFASLFGDRAASLLERAVELGEQARVNPIELERDRARFDAIAHRSGRLVVVETERTSPEDDLRRSIADGNLAIARLQSASKLDALFETATQEVARITGFDRVMLYRFHPDDSGEVVAESRVDDELTPFLGLRYPESDIPSQARRLYVHNPLRLIVDVAARPSPLSFAPWAVSHAPLDLTHATLRSVSPIHIEYLRNMGVGASMSISLVVDGRLYGLIACHHRTPHRVAYAVRMACEHLGRTASLQIAALTDRRKSRVRSAAAVAIGSLVTRCEQCDTLEQALLGGEPSLKDVLPTADSVSLVHQQEISQTPGAPPHELVQQLIAWLAARGPSTVLDDLPLHFEAAREHAGTTAGLLAVEIDAGAPVWVLWHRREQARKVEWGHEPSKQVVSGPHGSVLAPPRSFEAWVQSVEGKSAPWSDAEVEMAEVLRYALTSAVLRRLRRQAETRKLFMRIVGHDLRSPLSAIVQGTTLLGEDTAAPVRERALVQLRRASRRMQEMLEHFLDFQRIEAGLGLELRPGRVDVAEVVRGAVEEARLAHSDLELQSQIQAGVFAVVDADRFAQVVANLIANARNHGDKRRAVGVRLWLASPANEVCLSVHNWGAPIPTQRQREIFDAYRGLGSGRRPRGLGLGLHIVRWIVHAHGGRIEVTSSEAAGTTFEVSLPRAGP